MVENEPTEACLLGSEILRIPRAFITETEVFHNVLSYTTWQNELTEHEKQHILKLLPPNLAGENQEACLRDLFNGSNFKFGNPLSQFQTKLVGGIFDPSASRCRAICLKAKQKQRKLRMQQYHTRLLEQLIMLQQVYVDEALHTSTKQEFCERLSRKSLQAACKQRMQPLDFNDVKTISRAARLRRYRILQEVKEETGCIDSSSADEEDALMDPIEQLDAVGHLSSEQYKHTLRQHRKRRQRRDVSPGLETGTVSSIHDVIGRVFMTKARKVSNESSVTISTQRQSAQKLLSLSTKGSVSPLGQAASAKKYKRRLAKQPSFDDEDHVVESRQAISGGTNELSGGADSVALHGIISDDWDLDANGLDSQPASGSDPVGLHHEDFFALLGHIVQSFPNSRASTQKIEERVREWQEAVAASKASDTPGAACGSDKWYADGGSTATNWVELVQPALKYLAGDTAAGIPYNGTFVPLVDYKERLQLWRWLGIETMASAWQKQHSSRTPGGIDGVSNDDDLMDSAPGEDGSYRRSLWAHWLDNKTVIVASAKEGCHGGRQREPTPPSRIKTTYVVKPSSDEERAAFRKQELERFANPRRSFTYLVNGYDAVVGPVKGVYDKSAGTAGGNKAREHALLVSERPSYVTILTLVRDAAARLPNGEGTRSDICELLKDSQYLADGVTENQINTVVSGALDRLHYEKDPCVKYDVVKKLWIYLHRNRSENEFERIHEVQGAVVKAKKAHIKPKSASSKRLRAAAGGSTFSAADARPDNSGGADDIDLDDPPISPLSLLPMDSPPVPQLHMPRGGLPPSPAASAASAAAGSPDAVLPTHKSVPVVSAPSVTGGQQSLINRLVVGGIAAAPPSRPRAIGTLAGETVGAPTSDSRASSSASSVTASLQHQRAQPRAANAAAAASLALPATSSAPFVGPARPAAAAAAAAATAAAQQHYTFSLVPSTSVATAGMVSPLAKAAAPASTVATVRAAPRSGPLTAAALRMLDAAGPAAATSLPVPALADGTLASIVVQQQQRRRGSGMRHVMVRQQLPGGVGIAAVVGEAAAPPASPPVIRAASGQIRLRLEQPVSLVSPVAARPVAGSIVLQPAAVPGAASLDRSAAPPASPATAAASPVVLTVRDGSSAGAVGSILGSKQVFSQKASGIPGATVLQKIITAVPQPSGRTPAAVAPSVAVMQNVGGGQATQMVARIVQSAASMATASGTAQVGTAGRVVQQLISAVPGSTLTLPAATFTRSLTTTSASVAPGTTFKLVTAPQVTVTSAAGVVPGTTLVKPGMASALLTEKGAKLQAASDMGHRPVGAHVVLAAPSSHQLAEGNVPQRIILSTAARSSALTSATSAPKAVGTVTVAAGGAGSSSAGGGQVITTYYTATSSGVATASPTAFILTKPISTAPSGGGGGMLPASAMLGTQQVAYSLTADGSSKGKTMVYGRLISNAAHVGGQQQQMVITRPTTATTSGHHPATTVIVGQSPVAKNDSLIIVPVKKAPSEKAAAAAPDSSR